MLSVGLLAWFCSSLLPVAPAQGTSIEGFLHNLRVQRDGHLAAVRPAATAAVKRLESLGRRAPAAEYQRVRQDLARLGGDAAPVLVPFIDPGEDALGGAQLFRARELTDHLSSSVTAPITAALVDIARTGTPAGRANALRLLGSSDDTERAGIALADLYAAGSPTDRLPALEALLRLGGTASRGALSDALASEDAELVRAALAGLAESSATWAIQDVRAFLSNRHQAARHVLDLIEYFRAIPESTDDSARAALMELATDPRAPLTHRGMLLEAMPSLGLRPSSANKSKLNDLAESIDREPREGALIALIALGDRGARRKLLRPFNDEVDRRKRSGSSYRNRAQVFMRIRDYASAVRDYKQALDYYPEDSQSIFDVSIELARAHLLLGKLRPAARVLEQLHLGAGTRETLRQDPDFAELRDHPRYGSALRES